MMDLHEMNSTARGEEQTTPTETQAGHSRAWTVVHVSLVAAPLLIGFDNFPHLSAHLESCSPALERLVGFSSETFACGVGALDALASATALAVPKLAALLRSICWGA